MAKLACYSTLCLPRISRLLGSVHEYHPAEHLEKLVSVRVVWSNVTVPYKGAILTSGPFVAAR